MADKKFSGYSNSAIPADGDRLLFESAATTNSVNQTYAQLKTDLLNKIGISNQGAWNASTNTPALANGTGTRGHFYIVSVAGSTSLDGISEWKVGDWPIFDGTAWQKIDNTSETSFSDAVFTIFNSSDITKKIDFAAVGISTGTTRTISMPDQDLTLDTIVDGTTLTNLANTRIPYSDGTNIQSSTNLTFNGTNLSAAQAPTTANHVVRKTESDLKVDKATFDANTLLKADSDNTPVALSVTSSTFVGRKSTGSISAMTVAESKTELGAGVASGLATLDVGGKVPASQLPSTLMDYLGNWNASTNSPSLTDGTGSTGDIYRVSVAGTQDLGSGSQTFAIGDWVIYNGTIWEKSDNTDAVATVFGRVGTIVSANGDYTASQLTNVAAGNIVAVTVQAAINELDSDKQASLTNGADSLTTAEVTQVANINSVTVSNTQWGYVGGLNQSLSTSDSPTFSQITGTLQTAAQPNITNVGTLTSLTVSGDLSFTHSGSTVFTLVPNAFNTITHNLGISSGQNIIAMNGDLVANGFNVTGIASSSTTSNSFTFYASGGIAGLARLNWMILKL